VIDYLEYAFAGAAASLVILSLVILSLIIIGVL